jgi:hypothetical protein
MIVYIFQLVIDMTLLLLFNFFCFCFDSNSQQLMEFQMYLLIKLIK